MNNKTIEMLDFKVKNEKNRTFTCYGNVKGNIDQALDRTLDGAYLDSVEKHKADNTMPKMFWNHNHYDMPVGIWPEMKEDSTGLLLGGKMSATSKGQDIFTLMQDEAITQFSIGYSVVEEKWNTDKGCNDLIKLDIHEISPVTWACNELSTLQSIQKSLKDGELLSKADLRQLLQLSNVGLSKRQIDNITGRYNNETTVEKENRELIEMLEKSSVFS